MSQVGLQDESTTTATAPASVTDARGQTFSARVGELLPNSLMLKELPFDLGFREHIRVELFGVVVNGEVVYAAQREAAVVFETTPEIFEAIEAFEDSVHERPTPAPALEEVAHDDPTGPSGADPVATIDLDGGVTPWDVLPVVSPEGVLETTGDLERLGLLLLLKAGRPVLVRAESDEARVTLEPNAALALVAIPIGDGLSLLHPPTEHGALDEAVQTYQRAVLPKLDGADTAPDPDDLPTLTPHGSIRFRSREQLRGQYALNLSNGAIMARGQAPALGTRQPLLLVIPNAEPIALATAEVVFTEGDRVGFSVPDTDSLKKALKALLSIGEAPPPPASESPPPPPPKPRFDFRDRLAPMPDAGRFMQMRHHPPDDLPSARGWYVGLVDRVLRSGRDALITLDDGNERFKMWIYGHRVVAIERLPPPERDRLGERLLAARKLDPAGLTTALEQAKGSGRPLGQVILSCGLMSRADLHKALRKQILERAVAPCDWTSGTIEIGGWSDPPVDADLLPVSADAVVTALLKRQLQHTRLATLRDELTPHLNRSTTVDLARISEGYRLSPQEHRYFQRAAESRGNLATMVSMVKTRPLEGYRLILLGAALGFVSFDSPPR